MSINFRRKLFLSFVLLFLIVGTGIIYYSQGFRIDLASFSIKKTGAIYIESLPRDALIFINGKEFSNKSSILQKGTLITNILPKKYRLILKKEGFHEYQKNIEVFPSQVTRILNALLIPQTLKKETIAQNLKGEKLIDIDNFQNVLTQDKNNTYYLTSLKKETNFNLSSRIASFFKSKIINLKFSPQEENTFLAQTVKGIYLLDLDQQKTSLLLEGEFENFFATEKNLYALKVERNKKNEITNKKIIIYDLTLNKEVFQEEFTFFNPQEKVIDLKVGNGLLVFLLENGALGIYSPDEKSFRQIAFKAKQFSFSPDKSKIVFQDKDGKIFVYLLSDEIVSLEAPKESYLRIQVADASKIEKIYFYKDSFHLLLEYPQQIQIAEITKLEPNNQFLITNKKGEAAYLLAENKIYLLEDTSLKRVDLNFSSY